MSAYKFSTLNPSPKAREAELARLQGVVTLGIEVTVPELATACSLGNIDPQHSGGDISRAAIEVALDWPLPLGGTTLATVRADLDSVGAMAVMLIRMTVIEERHRDHDAWHATYSGEYDDCPYLGHDATMLTREERARVESIAKVDKFAAGDWPGRKSLPRKGEKAATAEVEFGIPAGLSKLIMDFKTPLDDRVQLMVSWILTGDCPGLDAANAAVQAEWDTAVDATTIYAVYDRVDDIHPLREFQCSPDIELVKPMLAYAESTARFATTFAYRMAPVIVLMNPSFSFQGAPAGRKYTIAQHQLGHVDMPAVLSDLQALEPGWGGSPTIVGSPQGGSSTLEPEQVVLIVLKHLL